MHPKTLTATALLIATFNLYAADTDNNKSIADNAKQAVIPAPENKDEAEMTPNDYKAMITNLDDVRRLPVTGISLVRSDDQMLLISDNGRFAVTGKFRLIDIWNAKEIKTMDDAVGFDKLDLKKVGIKDSDLSMLTLGNGPKEVMAFVDPYCKHCHNLIGQIDDALKAAYTFKLVLVPIGKESAVTIKK